MKTARLVVLGFLLGMFLVGTSCGKKGPPFLPHKAFSTRVVDLSGEWTEGYISLKGTLRVDAEAGRSMGPAQGCRVYYAQYPLDNPPCAGCPVEYHGYQEFGPEVITEQGLFCRVPAEVSGQVYFLKVRLIGPEGTEGPSSDTIRVMVE